MPTLRELQKRLESAETIKQLSGAMRSASTAKYTKLCSALESFSTYADALQSIVRSYYADGGEDSMNSDVGQAGSPSLCILISGNRGLCGGYNQQLFGFFEKSLKERSFRVAVCGKKAFDFCRTKSIPIDSYFKISDVPVFEEAKDISEYAYRLYTSNEVDEITVCSQRFYNMLKFFPEMRTVLQKTDEKKMRSSDELIFIPDRDSIIKDLEPHVLAANIYHKLLSSAAGAQGATVVAMKSAYDNAKSSIASLEAKINRLRQAAVTASVIETSAEYKEQK